MESKSLISVKNLFLESWQAYITRFDLWRWFVLWQIISLTSQNILSRSLENQLPLLTSFTFVSGLIISSWLNVGVILGVNSSESFSQIMSKSSTMIGRYFRQMLLVLLISVGGIVLFFIPLIILIVPLAFVGIVLVIENSSGLQAVFKSWGYIKGYWKAIFWRLFLLNLPITFAILPLFTLGKEYLPILTSIQIALESFIFPFEFIVLVKIYQNLKILKQGESVEISGYFRGLVRLCLFFGGGFILLTIISVLFIK